MTTHRASLSIPAPLHVIRQILLEPDRLADWNQAFLSIDAPPTATVGTRYPISARGGLHGHWEYESVSAHRIDARWQVPGLRETNSWHLYDSDRFTRVVHTYRQQGALAALLIPATAGVGQLRLARLAERATARHLTDA